MLEAFDERPASVRWGEACFFLRYFQARVLGVREVNALVAHFQSLEPTAALQIF